MFLSVKPCMSSIKSLKLAARYVEPFTILQKVNPIAYKLELLVNLAKLHNVFHVFLKKYVQNPNHLLDVEKLQLIDLLFFEFKPVRILDLHSRMLRNCEIESAEFNGIPTQRDMLLGKMLES